MKNIQDTLAEREKRYGVFEQHANITQQLKADMRWFRTDKHGIGEGWDRLTLDQREALEMIVLKIGRILNGDPNYADSWRDIAGYATLVANRLEGKDKV
jgi:hypothetical protein